MAVIRLGVLARFGLLGLEKRTSAPWTAPLAGLFVVVFGLVAVVLGSIIRSLIDRYKISDFELSLTDRYKISIFELSGYIP